MPNPLDLMQALRYLKIQYKCEALITTIAYSATAISLLVDVLSREFLGEGIWGASRFAVYAAIVAGFIGMSLATVDKNQIRPHIFDAIIPIKFELLICRLSDLTAAIMYVALTFLAANFVKSSHDNNDIAAVLDWQLWPIQLVLPLSFCTVSIRYILYVYSPSLKAAFISAVEGNVNA